MAVCDQCNGSGKISPCPRCQGSGTDPDHGGNCNICDGSGTAKCPKCDGTGTMPD